MEHHYETSIQGEGGAADHLGKRGFGYVNRISLLPGTARADVGAGESNPLFARQHARKELCASRT